MVDDALVRFRAGAWAKLKIAEGQVEFVHDVRLKIQGLGDAAEPVAALLSDPRGFFEADLSNLLGVKRARTIVATLCKHYLIRPDDAYTENPPDELKHQARYLDAVAPSPRQAGKAIAGAKVLIVGVGGIGALVLQHLMGAGVRTVHLVDADVVSASNMNRQYLFMPDQIGRPKVELAADYARKFHGANITTSSSFIEGPDCFDDSFRSDVVVCAADQPPGLIRSWTAEHARRQAAAFIGCGVGINRGYWGPLVIPAMTPCHRCTEGEAELTEGGALDVSFGPVNSMIAAGVAAQVVWALANSVPAGHLGCRTVLDLVEPALRLLPPAVRDEGCPDSRCVALKENLF